MKNTTSITIASIFAVTSLFAVAETHFNDKELGIGKYREQAYNNPRFDDKELGIGKYRDVG